MESSAHYINAPLTAAGRILMSCHVCRLLCRYPDPTDSGRHFCPRCGAVLHKRKPHSMARTWALLFAAFFCYPPANLLPVTISTKFGETQTDTIMSGVIYFMTEGDWIIAGIIFTASIMVPLLKLLVLTGLLISVHFKSSWRPEERTVLYRFVEVIGRWSMVDIFVVTILVALVRLQALMSIHAGPGVLYFGAVVVLTMLAAHSFDPRLIWDALAEDDRPEPNTLKERLA